MKLFGSMPPVTKARLLFATAICCQWSPASALQNNPAVITAKPSWRSLQDTANNNSNACETQIAVARTCLDPEPGCQPCLAGTLDGIFARSDDNGVGCVDFAVGICPAIASDCADCAACRAELESLYGCIVQQLSNGACSGLDCNLSSSDAKDRGRSVVLLAAGAMTLMWLGKALL